MSSKWLKSDPQRAFDGDLSTYWETPPRGWIEADFGESVRIDRLAICESRPEFRSAVRKFEVLYKNEEADEWQKLDEGTGIGFDYSKRFDPVTARYVRLNFLDSGRVQVRELHFFQAANRR